MTGKEVAKKLFHMLFVIQKINAIRINIGKKFNRIMIGLVI